MNDEKSDDIYVEVKKVIKVYLRHIDDGSEYLFGLFEPIDIEDLVSLIKEHGVRINTEDDYLEVKYVDSQFVVTEYRSIFEILVSTI